MCFPQCVIDGFITNLSGRFKNDAALMLCLDACLYSLGIRTPDMPSLIKESFIAFFPFWTTPMSSGSYTTFAPFHAGQVLRFWSLPLQGVLFA
jgi:hypothetical protein